MNLVDVLGCGILVRSTDPIKGAEPFLEGMRTNQSSSGTLWYLMDSSDGAYLGRREANLVENEVWRWWRERSGGCQNAKPTAIESRFLRGLVAVLVALRSLPGWPTDRAQPGGPWWGEFQVGGNGIPSMEARCLMVFPHLGVEASHTFEQAPFSVRAFDANELERLMEATRRGGCDYFDRYHANWSGCLVIERRRMETHFPDILSLEGLLNVGTRNVLPDYLLVRDEYFNACGVLLRETMVAEYEEALYPCVLMGGVIIDLRDPRVPGGQMITIFQPSRVHAPASLVRYFLPLAQSWGIHYSREAPKLINGQFREVADFGIAQRMDGEAKRVRQSSNADLAGFNGPGRQPEFLGRFIRLAGEARLARGRMGGQDNGVSMALFATALEVLLGKKRGSETGITEAISRRGAALFCPPGPMGGSHIETREGIRRLYNARSRLLHDGVGPAGGEVDDMEELVRSVFARGMELLATLTSGRPGMGGEDLHRCFLEELDRRHAAGEVPNRDSGS